MKNKTSNLIVILQELLDGKSVTSIDAICSNRNQYFRTIKKKNIELIEVWKPNFYNKGQHKERRLFQSIDNINRAKKYLCELRGVNYEN